MTRAFPGGAVAETPHVHCRKRGLSPWLRKWVPTCLTVQLRNPRNQTRQNVAKENPGLLLDKRQCIHGELGVSTHHQGLKTKLARFTEEKGAHRIPSNKKPEASALRACVSPGGASRRGLVHVLVSCNLCFFKSTFWKLVHMKVTSHFRCAVW